MKNFQLHQALSLEEATRLVAAGAKPLAGGQDLLTELKEYLVSPDSVVNLKSIPGLAKLTVDAKGARLGALLTLSEIEYSQEVAKLFPALTQAAHSVASVQIRNLATLGGNLCQRPRCWYYRDEAMVCLKKGGSQCFAAAREGENKFNAILGGGPSFIVHPSDLATVLVCLDAQITVIGPGGKQRQIPAGQFFTLPNEGSLVKENVLGAGELIVEVSLPASPLAAHSVYIKFKERDSLDFAVAAVAMAVEMKNGKVAQARIVLGGVAPIPWRVPGAEKLLIGKYLDEGTLESAAHAALEGARPLSKNAFKIPLTRALVKRAGQQLAGGH